MKPRNIFAALLITSLAACSKSAIDNNTSTAGNANVIPASSVPAAVTTSFNNSFRNASEIEWQRHSSSFEVQFNEDSQRHDATFDDSGHQSSHSIICLSAPVPQVVLDAFRQNFATDNVYEWKLTNNGEWKAHFMRGSVKFEATFSASGALIKFEQSK